MKSETKQQIKTATTTTATTTTTAATGTTASLTKPKKTCTTLICELTRLKTQQKYLECNQLKLNPDHFEDAPTMDNAATTTSSPLSQPTAIKQFVLDVEQLKIALEEELNMCRVAAKRDVEDMWIAVNDIKRDVLEPERLREFSVAALRERIIAINTQLNRLNAKNVKQLNDLQTEELRLEGESRLLFK